MRQDQALLIDTHTIEKCKSKSLVKLPVLLIKNLRSLIDNMKFILYMRIVNFKFYLARVVKKFGFIDSVIRTCNGGITLLAKIEQRFSKLITSAISS